MNNNVQLAITNQEGSFKQTNPEMDWEKERLYALSAISKNDFLSKTDPKSMASAVLQVAMSGLSLNPTLAHGYLVPRGGKCVFQPGYQGLIYLLVGSGLVKDINARVVYENDEFELEFGDNAKFRHKPATKNKGEIIGAYAEATLGDGIKTYEYIDIDEIKSLARRGDMNKGKVELVGAWKTDLGEMCRKTVIRRIYKYLPKTNVTNKVMFERLQNAVESIDKEHKSEATPIADVFDEFTDVTTEATPPPAMEKPPIASHNAVPIKEEAQPIVKETKTSSIKPPTSN
jgi:recombination protein RecT